MSQPEQNIPKEDEKRSVEAVLDDLDRQIKINKAATEKRTAELDAKIEILQKQIQLRTPPASPARKTV